MTQIWLFKQCTDHNDRNIADTAKDGKEYAGNNRDEHRRALGRLFADKVFQQYVEIPRSLRNACIGIGADYNADCEEHAIQTAAM